MTLLNIRARREGLAATKPVPHWSAPFALVPYADKGRSMDGADCYGWIRLVFSALQPHIVLPPHDLIDPHDGKAVAEAIKTEKGTQLWLPVSPDALQPLDLVVMRSFYKDKKGKFHTINGHLGVMVDDKRLLHMEEDLGVLLGSLKDEHIRSRLLGEYYRHRDIKPIQ